MKSSAHKGAYIILPIGTKSLILARGLVLSEYVNQSHTCNFSSLNFFFSHFKSLGLMTNILAFT